jgi:Ca2+-binding EF-hand superfamily protein
MASLPLTTAAAVAQTAAGGQTGGAAQHSAGPEVRKLLLLMDKDQNGKVSRTEFMAFMAKEFDRLDVNKDGELDVNELTALRVSSKHPGGAGSK